MGRKPNPLILKYFERGAKLNDSSNRYEHTCKACGEKFPKGRIDSLTTHLVKKCQAMNRHDRSQAIFALHGIPDPSRGHGGEVQMNGPTVDLPIGATRGWNALETLAEVSRQMGMTDDPTGVNRSTGAASGTPEPPREERLQLREQYTLDNPPVSYEQRPPREKKSTQVNRRESEASLPAANFTSHMTHSRSTSPNLAMAATSMAAAAAARFVPSMVDPQLLAEDQHMAEPNSMEQDLNEANNITADHFFNTSQDHQSSWQPFDGLYHEPEHIEHSMESTIAPRASSYPRIAPNQPMIEFTAEFGTGQKSVKPKVRGQFDLKRRREVQEVRKIGACLRCRMLKKPCSASKNGEPCQTCKNVDSARLWKNPCIRKKIAEEVQTYSCNLHSQLAHQEVKHWKEKINFLLPAPYQIDVSHYPEETGVFAKFDALFGDNNPTNIDPGLSSNAFFILDNKIDDVPNILAAYLKRMRAHFFEKEPSHFMSVTLQTAQSLHKPSSLLDRALDLWATVHVLVDLELHWTFFDRLEENAPSGHGPIINRPDNVPILSIQLNAAAEKKASQLCKAVLLELEQCLLKRSPETNFETFLVAIILLNCMEKSTWVFKSWEQDDFIKKWQLGESPTHYISQCVDLSETLQMLLRMRNIPPKTRIRPDGILFVEHNPASLAPSEYFEKLQLNHYEVEDKQNNSAFDPGNSRCFELLYCSKLLLPPKSNN